MNNREVYRKDPSTLKLVNEGVASVNDKNETVLRYELETFVCEGRYRQRLEHILEQYLKNIDQAQQPGVWISGFYGSGKSHLVKILTALWINTPFKDGDTPRLIVTLPDTIKDLFKELDTEAKRNGGMHAASGTVGASGQSVSVALSLLSILFRSLGLPEDYQQARFVMWLKSEGIYKQLQKNIKNAGHDWEYELTHFYTSKDLYSALCELKPLVFSKSTAVVDTMLGLYPPVDDISNRELISAFNDAIGNDGKFPLTLIVMDELQAYIGDDSERSRQVQEVVETCTKAFGGKLLFIGTGQTAVTGTANLNKISGRFTIPIELMDADVDTVVRKVILAKKPSAVAPINAVMEKNLGEISRHLSSTTFAHHQEDTDFFAADYPLLPVRRRFWEHTLRVLDQTGTDSQLRNQLSMAHKAVRTNLDKSLGAVVPTDFLYFDAADRLLRAQMLPRNVYEKTLKWMEGSAKEKLMARACGTIFLINKLQAAQKEIGIQSTVDTIADLLTEDLAVGSSKLRNMLPETLDNCPLLTKIKDEYRIITKEGAEWNSEFQNQRHQLANEAHRIEADRNDRIRQNISGNLHLVRPLQGTIRVPRDLSLSFDSELPKDHATRLYIWVRDGWAVDEESFLADARQAGNQSPTIFVFIPKRSADALRYQLIEKKAADATINHKGNPSTPEGLEARAAMETILQTAENKLNELIDEAISGARVIQAGGAEIQGTSFVSMISEACNNSLQRLYPQFKTADQTRWDRVYAKAKEGAPDALSAINYEGEPAKQDVCKAIMQFIMTTKKGSEIRGVFESSPYGWSKDTIDGALQVLLINRLLLARAERGQAIDPKRLERRDIGKTEFKLESTVVTTKQRIDIRKVMLKVDVNATSGNESASIPSFLRAMNDLATSAGGEPPRPEPPDIKILETIDQSSGNDQLMAIYNLRDKLIGTIDSWTQTKKNIEHRLPLWESLEALLKNASGSQSAGECQYQVEAIRRDRLLLAEPDAIVGLMQTLQKSLKKEINAALQSYQEQVLEGMQLLKSDAIWKQLDAEEQKKVLAESGLVNISKPKLSSDHELIEALGKYPLPSWNDRIAAIPSRIASARAKAIEMKEPELQSIAIDRSVLRTLEDVDLWVDDLKKELTKAVKKGPISIK